ncbi:UDP-N-acetylmuramate:L-alanyl-gamma-D-glutamyl-meso-diaminopimelate ligase [Alginatibacterium sediminis]|uniref:UDP-N-acetylmuramate--L-alanyl-gamma-D-glutamyl-meso-2,6-diaminoheptandioate ligase n=1 Tax=Alginatibacterium sediminis TaxID=2164068 RepID=A0A420E991_9ALTE|nr:UDP-N-acetylmuramate:L-alanyl-gamma-D-glutamyl-meso-diaminopimelate ligase [Alginatibacterium sediminis]RKF15864.1 UDP-N-acetylmuramate:L-alanyl-gamma-D-glutamyl-meso-diaminopimelate ligase [Alginatibacterium sediminis]
MHIHILGICGTFMGGLALLARQLGHQVSGSDQHVYPPMSTQLQEQGIELIEGYDPSQLDIKPDLVVIGNAMSRGNPCVEHVLDHGLRYCSGPQWLREHLLQDRWVLAVAGTHGKTSTASILAWILEANGLSPGFLIGGIPQNFGVSARLGSTPFFVVEADEYDSAFFDKRSKFVHYQPRTLVLNNLEFDHADIFDDLAAIERQFHHLMRTIPSTGRVIAPLDEPAIERVLQMGCWSELERSGESAQWSWSKIKADSSEFEVYFEGKSQGIVNWSLIGEHNLKNAIMAIAAARHVGILPQLAIESLARFTSPKRRLELLYQDNELSLYDDFAHHPSAIETTLKGLKAQDPEQKIVVVLEARSNSMRMGAHAPLLGPSLQLADQVLLFEGTQSSDSLQAIAEQYNNIALFADIESIVQSCSTAVSGKTVVVVMSNGGFSGIHKQLEQRLKARSS